ncbi:MAG: hypothetical protein PHV82_13570 [Victivallaceae bacterium]|nr:hypothetical protein [Victivallaceae bacterium]
MFVRAVRAATPRSPENEVIIPDMAVVKFKAGKKLKAEVEALKPEKLRS